VRLSYQEKNKSMEPRRLRIKNQEAQAKLIFSKRGQPVQKDIPHPTIKYIEVF